MRKTAVELTPKHAGGRLVAELEDGLLVADDIQNVEDVAGVKTDLKCLALIGRAQLLARFAKIRV